MLPVCCAVYALRTDIAAEAHEFVDSLSVPGSMSPQQQHPELLQGVQPPALKLLLQLLQHVLYYAVNGRIAELYAGHGAATQPAAAADPAAAAAAGSTAIQRQQNGSIPMVAEDSHMGVAGGRSDPGSPASVLASALLDLRQAFVGLFPVGRQFSAAETAELKQQVAAHLRDTQQQQQQQQQEDRQADEASADAQAAAAAAVGDVSRLLQLVQRWLQPQAACASGAASDDDEQSDTGSSDGDEEVADEQQQQQQKRPAPAVAVTQEQLQQAVLELGQDSGFSIAGLATLEQQLQERFGVQKFVQLGLGAESLLQLLQQQQQLLALLQGSKAATGAAAAADVAACDALAPVPLAAVLQVAAQAKACCGDMEEQGEVTMMTTN
jgi:hypothetical protein